VVFESDLDLIFTPLEALASEGVQIIGFVSPTHAFSEEAGYRNQTEHYYRRKQELAKRFKALADQYEPKEPCSNDKDAVLWDFTGFQPFATTSIPAESRTVTHILFHEPAHYRKTVGTAILGRMLDQDNPKQIPGQTFGVRLTPDFPADLVAQTETRRRAWLETEDGQLVSGMLKDNAGIGEIRQIPPLEAELRQIEELIDSSRSVR